VKKGGRAAVYTCPGSADAGSGVIAPVAYGQCDGGFASRALGARGFRASLAGSGIKRSFAPVRSQPARRQAARIASDIRCLASTIRRRL
jgi:hypothetical protein